MTEVIAGISIQWYIYLSVILFTLGALGVMLRKNAIIIFMCIELMLNAVNLLLVAFSRYLGDSGGQVMVFFIMVVAAAEVAVGLAILMMVYRNIGNVNIDNLRNIKH
jgi:NADH-quinone oxidoreductase subunit K